MAITLRTLNADYAVPVADWLLEEAKLWTAILRNRGSWSRLPDFRSDLAQKSRATLKKLCPELESDSLLERLASAGLVEIRFTDEDTNPNAQSWALPWEFLISAATERKRNRANPLLVFRYLASEGQGRSPIAEPTNLLVIKNNPGFLGSFYGDQTFLREERNVSVHLKLPELPSLHNEPLKVIEDHTRITCPAVIHVAGVDLDQAASFNPEIAGSQNEALMLHGAGEGIVAATAEQLAPAICAGKEKPVLVSLNFVNSASQMAPAIVRQGAGAVLAFLNDFDDIVAEAFFANFYLGWRLSRWNLLDAFRLAWNRIPTPTPERIWGSGLVLWSRESLLDRERPRLSSGRSVNPAMPAESLQRDFNTHRQSPIPDEEETNITVGVKPYSEINYSVLHNNRNMFEYFFVRKPQCVGRLSNLGVHVTLHAGETLSYRTKGEVSDTIWVLHDDVQIPLTSSLVRSVRESMYTALVVSVSWKDRILLERTFRVSLLPIDQWQDDPVNRKWLPSFVLPRDPSISKIIDTAQRHLVAMLDDINGAFDGYQLSVGKMPTHERVMTQVKAIWWSLVNDQQISYTVPPPTYTASAQRLRSPTSLLKAHRGTCIDFTLLLAACLENIDIYAAIFLLRSHALVGFYRDRAAHKKVRDWLAQNATRGSDAWVLGKEFFPQLSNMLKTEEIVPIETTCLAKRQGLSNAIEEARSRLKNQGDFEYFFDLKLARDSGVTPLPLVDSD